MERSRACTGWVELFDTAAGTPKPTLGGDLSKYNDHLVHVPDVRLAASPVLTYEGRTLSTTDCWDVVPDADRIP